MPLTPAERTRRHREKKFAELDRLPKIPCACGCGTLIAPITKALKPATYAHGHNPDGAATRFKPGDTSYWNGKPNPHAAAANRGKKRTPDVIAQRQATRLANNGGVYQVKRGWKHTDATRARMTIANRQRDMRGAKNPFYRKTHTPETRKRITARISGPLNPAWRGGAATLPYGPEFTRKFKHLIRQRDGYTCQRCGKTQEQEGRVLQVHHLDHNKMHNDPTNLVTSCGSCNVWASYHRDEPFKS